MGPPSQYCRICGTANPITVGHKLQSAAPSKTVAVSLAALGSISFGNGPRSHEVIKRSTQYCRVCREIDVECDYCPIGVEVKLENTQAVVIFPEELVHLIVSSNVEHGEIARAIQRYSRKVTKYFRRWVENGGGTRCRDHRAGIESRIRIGPLAPKVFVIFDNDADLGDRIGVRLTYGGGRAQCP